MATNVDQEAGQAVGRAQRMVKATIIGHPTKTKKQVGVEPDKDTPAEASRTLAESEVWTEWADRLVPPPYNLTTLSRFPELSGELSRAIEAMEVNIEGFGHRLVSRFTGIEDTKVPDAVKKRAKFEKVLLENLFESIALDVSFTAHRRNTRTDLEATGNAYWEVIRTRKGKRIMRLKQLPSYQIRLGIQDKEFTQVNVPVIQIVDNDFQIEQVPTYKRFRAFAQGQTLLLRERQGELREMVSRRIGKIRWFKSFGDPRVMDNETGDYVPPEEVDNWKGTNKPMPEGRRANEVIHFRIYSPRSPYGIPRYIGELLSILGERKAGEINLTTISNNNVPSAVFAVSNGMLTEATIKRIETYAEILQSDDNMSRFLVVEAEGDVEGEDSGQVRIDIKPMTDVQLRDALFQGYVGNCRDAIRRSFRIPRIFVGAEAEVTKANTEAGRKLADEQVFGPERTEVDWTINHLILTDLGIRYWRFESRTPNVTDNKELIQMLAQGERTGGVTPRLARLVIEDVFKNAADIPDLDPSKFDPDQPFSLTMADRVKNTGGTAGPTEIGQTVAPVQPSAQDEVAKAWRQATIMDLVGIGNAAQAEIQRAVHWAEQGD